MDIGISKKDREKIADGLSHLLADSFTLYLKTHNFHWNVTGPMFNTLHVMFMDQYTELWNALDLIAVAGAGADQGDATHRAGTVLKEIPSEWVAKTGLFEVHTGIADKDEYLTRPDKGRRLSKEAIDTVLAKCKKNPQVQVIVSDGLSTDAITANFDEILPSLLKGLQNAGLDVGTPFFVRYGRVKLEDQVGELLGAKVVILLIGERPGLGQSESMSCYWVYSPTLARTVESDRSCISNIHRAGTPPVEAAAVIVDLAKQMLQKQTSGINLNRA